MKRLIPFVLALSSVFANAAGSSFPLDDPNIDLTDKASLQRGAQTFMNYCLGCHTQQYQRYQRTFEDLGIPLDLGQQYLQFTGDKVSSYITNNMPTSLAAEWFGAPPPDLTLVARVRGPEWIYNYLRTFYVEDGKMFGVNNKVFPNAGMPHVLQGLQGTQRAQYEMVEVDGETIKQFVGFTNDGDGQLSATEYDNLVRDLTAYLEYTGEPSKLESHKIGRFVLAFIAVFFVLAFLLKKEYWRDIKH